MFRSRVLVALFLVALIAALLPVGHAAFAETELEKAERLASDARTARQSAESAHLTNQATANDLQVRLSATLSEYQRVNVELEILGLRVADVRSRMDATRMEIIALDRQAQERAVQAYIRGVATPGNALFLSGSFEAVSSAMETIKRASHEDEQVFGALDARRSDLAELTEELQGNLGDLAELNDQLAVMTTELEGLFLLADARVAEAYRLLEATDEAYRTAQANLEAEQAKQRWTGSVEQWRYLVEKYFPPDRVPEAMRVMACESRGNPNAKNPTSSATGLFQFLDGTWAWMSVMSGWGGYSRLDPEANVAVAAYLVEFSIRTGHSAGAWGHWECRP